MTRAERFADFIRSCRESAGACLGAAISSASQFAKVRTGHSAAIQVQALFGG
jgi:hypothetical protein